MPIPTTGERPIRFAAEGLPEGLRPESCNRAYQGRGTSRRRLPCSAARRESAWQGGEGLVIAIGRGLALTPPDGLEQLERLAALGGRRQGARRRGGLVSTGPGGPRLQLCQYGFLLAGRAGGAHNAIQPNSKFPDMRSLPATCSCPGAEVRHLLDTLDRAVGLQRAGGSGRTGVARD